MYDVEAARRLSPNVKREKQGGGCGKGGEQEITTDVQYTPNNLLCHLVALQRLHCTSLEERPLRLPLVSPTHFPRSDLGLLPNHTIRRVELKPIAQRNHKTTVATTRSATNNTASHQGGGQTKSETVSNATKTLLKRIAKQRAKGNL